MNIKVGLYSAVNLLLMIFISFCVYSCANRLSIEGGPKDEQAPRVDIRKADENFQTNFDGESFQITFDEFVKLDNPGEQIVVSPLLRYSLSAVSRGKKVIFNFHPEEVLEENTTYTIQFGESIQDITENNPIKNLRYVFSTGDKLDSMQITAVVVDLETKKPVNDVFVMLYDNLSDTMIRTGRPTYFSKSDSTGLAIVQNTKAGQYRVFALKDENRNYQLDLPEEYVGHIDTFVSSSPSTDQPFVIYIYKEIEPPFRKEAKRLDSLTYAIVVGGEIDYVEWSTADGTDFITYQEKDTVFVKFNQETDLFFLGSAYADLDSIKLNNVSKDNNLKKRFNSLEVISHREMIADQIMKLQLNLNSPVVAVDKSKFRFLSVDSTWIDAAQFNVDSNFVGESNLKLSWKSADLRDTILLLPGALRSWYAENDTAVVALKPLKTENLSNLIVATSDLNPANTYVLMLETDKGEELDRIEFSGVEQHEWTVPGLFPKKHKLTLLTDLNNNGRRDGGWFDTRQLPEPVFTKEINNLRPDWDVQVEIALLK